MIGFAAETGNPLKAAAAKREAKGCDWIVANDVAGPEGVFGTDKNCIILITADGADPWPRMSKVEVAQRLVRRISETLAVTA